MVIMPLPPMEIHGQLLLKLRMKQEVLFQYIYMVFVQRNNDYFFLAFNKKKFIQFLKFSRASVRLFLCCFTCQFFIS